jgi:cation-transporting ATPase E
MGMDTGRRNRTRTGLSSAEVGERVARGQVNVVPESPSRTTREIVRANLVTRFNILLGVLVVIVLVVVRDPRDALFGIVLVTNAAIGIIQELRAKATLDRLALLTAPKARVVRDGNVVEIDVHHIVLDDIVVAAPGDQIVVDGHVTAARGLEIDESLLTGESDPVLKEPGHACLSGSFVVAGSGRYRAERVGREAYAAALAKEAKRFTLVRSELRTGIDWILAAVSWAVGPVMVLLIWSQLRVNDGFSDAVSSAVAGAVGMIPQGLVLLTSIAFAVGVVRLGQRNVLVQELPAIEGLARVDTVCFDKTGTLTEGKLDVHSLEAFDDRDPRPVLGALGSVEAEPNATLRAVIRHFPAPDGWEASQAVPFSSARKWSGATFAGQGTWLLGAPEVLAPDDADLRGRVSVHADNGRRVLLVATCPGPLSGTELPAGLTPSALVVLGDRVRENAAETLRYFAQQGVVAKVISGDHPETVAAIAREVGVPGSGTVVDARTLPEDAAELAVIVENNAVFGRVTPYQKRAILGALQSNGHVVAMTGDGVNDVLALKDADIGVAIGSGSAAARSVAQLVLVDGSFETLPGVVAEGRRVIANIERVANLFVTKTVYAIFLALAVGLAGRPFPFLPRHLTLVGSVTIGIPAFFLALAPSARRARSGFITRVLRFALPTGLAAGLATLAAYELAIAEEVTLEEARTTATLVLAAMGLFALGIVIRPIVTWKKTLLGASIAGLLLLFVLPPTQRFFALDMPRIAVLMAALGIVAVTGVAMIGTLRAVGWIRTVPEYLRTHPGEPSRALSSLRTSIRSTGQKLRWSEIKERTRFWSLDDEDVDEIVALTGLDPPPVAHDAGHIEWLDPDDVLGNDIATDALSEELAEAVGEEGDASVQPPGAVTT